MKQIISTLIADLTGLFKIGVLVTLPTVILLGHVWNQHRVTEFGYEIASEARTHQKLQESNRKLRIEATYRGRPKKVVELAKRQFNLTRRAPDQMMFSDNRGQRQLAEQNVRAKGYWPFNRAELSLSEANE